MAIGFGQLGNINLLNPDYIPPPYQTQSTQSTQSGGFGDWWNQYGSDAMTGVGGFLTGLGAYQQAQSQRQGLGTALGYAKKIPGMIEEGYAPSLGRYEDLYSQYDPRGGSVFQGLKGTLASSMNAQLANVDPAMRKLLKRGNMQKAASFMQSQLPQFTQAQTGIAGSLAGLEQAKLGQSIGAQEQIGQLAAAKKSINPTAQAWGSLGATLSSILPFQGGEFVMNANAYNKNKSLLEAMNASDNEVTMMDSIFGEKHSGHGNQVPFIPAGKNIFGQETAPMSEGEFLDMTMPMAGTTDKVAKAIKKAGGLAPYYAKEAYKRISRAIKTGQINDLSAADTQLLKRSLYEAGHIKKKVKKQGGGKVKYAGGGTVMGEGNLLNSIIKKTYGM